MPKRKVIKYKVKQVVKCKRTLYSVKQKIQVITYEKKMKNIKAVKYFNVNRNMIRRQVKASSSWIAETKEKSKRVSFKQNFFSETKRRLYS